jgi:hypothetical protein
VYARKAYAYFSQQGTREAVECVSAQLFEFRWPSYEQIKFTQRHHGLNQGTEQGSRYRM